MIRRRAGNEFWLITQDDHARLAGQLATHFGNNDFARPLPQTLAAIANHDAGWPLHDDEPALNAAGLPLDVFETPRDIAHRVWLESARRAAAIDPYVGLLVTLHQFHLSAQSVPHAAPAPPPPFDVGQLREQFAINKFQHAMIEQIEALRRQINLSTDRPLRLGLADGWTNAAEDALRSNFRILQTLDGLSLAACCGRPPKNKIGPLHESIGAAEIMLTVERSRPERLSVSPWPFDRETIDFEVPYRAVPARMFYGVADLRSIYTAAEPKTFLLYVSQH